MGGMQLEFFSATSANAAAYMTPSAVPMAKLVDNSFRVPYRPSSRFTAGLRPKCSLTKTVRCSTSSTTSGANDTRSYRDVAATVVEFKMSDFDLYSHVSVGLAGRSDEILYEGIVKSPSSNLRGIRVVLRQLTGARGRRRGKRALEVISKLISREGIYHSYATRVHGYIPSSDQDTLTLVHGYYGCYSLHQWLLCVDWLPNLEERLALDEEAARRVGDHTTGGPQVTRQVRLIRMIMRDILIGVNYLHSQGLAHTELRLNNLHVSAADRHVKVGILGNAVEFADVDAPKDALGGNMLRTGSTRKRMVAYDIRCVGYVMARMVLRELMDPAIYSHLKAFLTKGHDPTGLREFLLPYISAKSPSGSTGLQVLDRDGGAGWHLLSSMLAIDPANRISCTDALRHPFLCGPRWHVDSSIQMIRWSLGSAAIRIIEEYIYMTHQRNRLAQLIDLLERVNPNTSCKEWMKSSAGKWRLLYHTGRQIGLTTRQASPAVVIGDVMQTFSVADEESLSMTVDVGFTIMSTNGSSWAHDKSGCNGSIQIHAGRVSLRKGERLYQTDTEVIDQSPAIDRLQSANEVATADSDKSKARIARKRKGVGHFLPKNAPKSLPIMRLDIDDFDISMQLDRGFEKDTALAQKLVQEVRLQIPREIFAVSKLVCATYIDSRLMILRGITGAALLFVKSPMR